MKFSLTTRLSVAIVLTGLVPALIIGMLAIHTADNIATDIGENCHIVAGNLADKIDRNLFERYGDVQAFGANEAVQDTRSWYLIGSESNKVARAASQYANLYGFYLLSFAVDLEGRVIAVNDRDPQGKPIDSAWLYQKNFKQEDWFQAATAGRFTKSETLDGTFTQDLHVDEDVKKIYGGDGLVLGFSAVIKDHSGKPIGVWHNCADFSLVEEIITDAYRRFRDTGWPGAELTLIDQKGRVLVDYDPSTTGKEKVNHDLSVLLRFNLAESGHPAAQALVSGKDGFGRFFHARKKIKQVNGYALSTGALGFPSFKWGVLIRIPEKEALAVMHAQVRRIAVIIVVSLMALIAVGAYLGRSISKPFIEGMQSMQHIGAQVGAAAREVANSSQRTAEGASEQAASLEETSASLEEISSMTKRNADNASNSATLGRQTRESATTGLERLNELSRTLEMIKSAVKELQTAVGEMQSSSQEISKIIKTIDEIAFQTNLLALNAAVEAARAGESGAGFAVVADEVRALAQRSAQAAKDTAEKIEASVKRSESGGIASCRVVESLGEVEKTANQIGQVFNGIVGQIKALDEVIAEIAAASKEQSQGVGEVNMAVSEMDKVTQSNAASAEENASAAEELQGQVHSLQGIVSQLQQVVAGGSNSNGAASLEETVSTPTSSKAQGAPSKTKSFAVHSTKISAAPGFRDVPTHKEDSHASDGGASGFKDF